MSCSPSRSALPTVVFSAGLALFAGSCAPTDHAHPHPHPHPHDPATAEAEVPEPDPVVVTVFTERAQLFLEHPRLLPGEEARFLAHVTVLATGEPVRSGRLQLELQGDSGSSVVLAVEAPKRDGLFIPVGALDLAGRYAARIVVESDQLSDTFELEPMEVYQDLDAAFAAAEAEAEPAPADAVPFLLEQQWKVGTRLVQATRRTLIERLSVPGEVEALHRASAVVGAPLAGRLVPPVGEHLPHVGERVEAGQVLAYLEPPLGPAEVAQLAATAADRSSLETEILMKELDLQARSLEVERSMRESETRLEFATAQLDRVQALRERDLGTIADLEAARQAVALADQAVESAVAMRESVREAEVQLAAVRERAATASPVLSGDGRLRVPLQAPIAGEIVECLHVEGEHIELSDAVYRVLDPSRVEITAHVSEADLAALPHSPGARVRSVAHSDLELDVFDDLDGRLLYFSRVLDPATRTAPLRYDVANPELRLRVGMLLDVFLETERAVDAVVVPRAAIVQDAGQSTAFVVLDGETFERRTVELGVRDGPFVEVRSGLEEGEYLVGEGAYLVKLAALSPDAFGHGHVH